MSMTTLERVILAKAKAALKNPNLRRSQILEWSTSEDQVKRNFKEQEEVMLRLPDPGVWIAVDKTNDRR